MCGDTDTDTDMVYQLAEDGEPPAKRSAPSIRVGTGFKWNLQTLAHAADAVECGGKSPVSALNELGVRVAYSVLRQGGPAHCPSFHVAVTVADMTFEGWGHSKREARAAAARACLAALLARAGRVLPSPSQHQDFTSDDQFPVSDFQCLEPKVKAPQSPAPPAPPTPPAPPAPQELTNGKEAPAPAATGSPAESLFGSVAVPGAHKSPINILYEKYAGLAFSCSFGDGSPLTATQAPLQLSHSMRFKVVCQIKDQKFEGYGSSKKLAKLAAARSALAVLEEGRSDCAPAPAPQGALHQTLADHIGKLVNEKFNELMKNDLVHSKRKVLAGIVITINNRTEDARVIAVTTGTKCVSGEHMSVSGRAVNDCHAEVAARRCLQRHVYAQLLLYADAPDPRQPIEESDLEPVPGGGYQLKASRQVHLYVSTAPCGDGRIFSPHEHHHTEPDKHPNRLARGQLRTKIESGEGTIPVKNCNNVLQTWDGVMQGERLLTMSCSDKVARWCVCGLQGALLSRLVRPLYLTSLVLGSLLHPHHMYRAICGRIEAYISSLPPPYHLRRPLLARAASAEARTPARAPSFSVCWCRNMPAPEVINATTGKLESGQPSLLCKQSMFARWHYLVQRLPLLPQEVDGVEVTEGAVPADLPEDPATLLYNEAKQMCPTYQLAKQRLIEAFEKAKLGRWIKRPLEQDQFVCELRGAAPQLLFAWVGPAPPARAPRPARPAPGPLRRDCTMDAVHNANNHNKVCKDQFNRIHVNVRQVGEVHEDGTHVSVKEFNYDKNNIDVTRIDKVAALRLPQSMSPAVIGTRQRDSNYNKLYGNDKIVDSKAVADTDAKLGDVGDRALSYYYYRNSNTCSNGHRDSHVNTLNLPKSYKNSAISRMVRAKMEESEVKTSVLDHNKENVDDNLAGRESGNRCSNDREVWDDDLGDSHLYYYDYGNFNKDVSCKDNVTDNRDDLSDVNKQLNNRNDDKEVKDITHKIQDVNLGDDKKWFWRNFYKNRQVKREDSNNTKDISNDVTDIENNAANNNNNLGEIKHAQYDLKHTNLSRLRFDTRYSIRPSVINTKDKLTGENVSDDVVNHHAHKLVGKHSRELKVDTSGNLRNTVVKVEKSINLDRSDVPRNETVTRDTVRVIKVEQDKNTDTVGNVDHKPIVMNKFTAYHMSRYRDFYRNTLQKEKYVENASTESPAQTETDEYFFNHSKTPNININNKSNDDPNNSSSNNIYSKITNNKPYFTKDDSKHQNEARNNDSVKVIVHGNNKNAQNSVKSSVLLRRLQIYEKISTKNK